jgi:hypothetical protein
MAWWRHSRLTQAVVMVLLLWTAADLTNTSLCALESEDTRSTVPAQGSTTIGDDSSGQIPREPATPHIDDCFCCSHCVEVPGLAPAMNSVPANREVRPLILAAPRLFGSRLYHPPLV